MAVTTSFPFFLTARDGGPNNVNLDADPGLMTQPGDMLVFLLNVGSKSVKEIWSLALLRESDYGQVYIIFAFTRDEGLLCSDHRSIGRFLSLWEAAEVSGVHFSAVMLQKDD